MNDTDQAAALAEIHSYLRVMGVSTENVYFTDVEGTPSLQTKFEVASTTLTDLVKLHAVLPKGSAMDIVNGEYMLTVPRKLPAAAKQDKKMSRTTRMVYMVLPVLVTLIFVGVAAATVGAFMGTSGPQREI